MTPRIHTLILEGQETFLLYKAIIKSRQSLHRISRNKLVKKSSCIYNAYFYLIFETRNLNPLTDKYNK